MFLGKTINSWSVELIRGFERLREFPIKRGIFQGIALLPLLFSITSDTNTESS